eukprot:859043-Karenia_brevis.AAC.1
MQSQSGRQPFSQTQSRRSALGGRGGVAVSALFQLSCRSVWRPKVRQGSRRSALGDRGGGAGSALFQLSC